ncbi:MAG: hypothetical protein AB7L90_22025 [Hyphomicrobiaceae bacterium]
MTSTENPAACTLSPSDLEDRLAWISALTTEALRRHERRDLVLELHYSPQARDRIREMVRNEQTCCSFLTFDLREHSDSITLTITAPEAARDKAEELFGPFVGAAAKPSACGCRAASTVTVGG